MSLREIERQFTKYRFIAIWNAKNLWFSQKLNFEVVVRAICCRDCSRSLLLPECFIPVSLNNEPPEFNSLARPILACSFVLLSTELKVHACKHPLFALFLGRRHLGWSRPPIGSLYACAPHWSNLFGFWPPVFPTLSTRMHLRISFFHPLVIFDFDRLSQFSSLIASSNVKPSSNSPSTASSLILFQQARCIMTCSGVVVISMTFSVIFSTFTAEPSPPGILMVSLVPV